MPGPAGITLVKLGGSLITDKTASRTLRPRRLGRLCRELATSMGDCGPLVLGHGSGSFGHAEASRSGIRDGVPSDGSDPQAVAGVSATRWQASRLHAAVLAAAGRAGLAPFSWLPSSAMVTRGGTRRRLMARPLVLACDLGLLPVTMGDVVMDERTGVSIQSTEAVFIALAAALARAERPVDRVVWCGETRGVLDHEGRLIDRIDRGNVESVLSGLDGAAGIDVTGGIRHRVETAWKLAQKGVPSLILNGTRPGRLAAALGGRPVDGTHVVA